MLESRQAALIVAATVMLSVLQPSRVTANWWTRAPADFEQCAADAGKAAAKEERTAALTACGAKFAGRRKPGGGYTYYDFLQDRSFDIAGPNPTPAEQKYIDQQYALYLERQRRDNIVAAFAAKQEEEELQQASVQTAERVPLPHARPSKLIASRTAEARAMAEARATAEVKARRDCANASFSCEWPRLSQTIDDVKKKLFGATPNKTGGDMAARANAGAAARYDGAAAPAD